MAAEVNPVRSPREIDRGATPLPESPRRFKQLLQQYHINTVSAAGRVLQDTVNSPNVCFMTVGSDARKESYSEDGPRPSPVEVLVYRAGSGPDTPEPERDQREARITRVVAQYTDLFDPRVQFIRRGVNPLEFRDSVDAPPLLIPSRAVDAVALGGSEIALERFQQDVIRELGSITDENIRQFNDKFYGPTSMAIRRVMKGPTEAVDLKTGKLLFDNRRNKSVKYVFCRAVQHKIVKIYMQAVKDKQIDPVTIVKEMPKTIVERLHWLHAKGLLKMSPEQLQGLVSAYNQCVRWYIQSQQAFLGGHDTIMVNPEELQRAAHDIITFFTSK